SQEWIVTLLDSYVDSDAPTSVSVEMMLNSTTLFVTILLVLVLNLVSALIPTLYSLRHSITVSLNNKK
ncbi:MAG: ABC transporter permease, partial [Bacteroidaceae bacterium]|nr:ABC transporter permease [Bacteroidaceae bacterium]